MPLTGFAQTEGNLVDTVALTIGGNQTNIPSRSFDKKIDVYILDASNQLHRFERRLERSLPGTERIVYALVPVSSDCRVTLVVIYRRKVFLLQVYLAQNRMTFINIERFLGRKTCRLIVDGVGSAYVAEVECLNRYKPYRPIHSIHQQINGRY
jgi:hypothetical protein